MEGKIGTICGIVLASLVLGGCEKDDSPEDSTDLPITTYVGCEGFTADTVGCDATQCPVTLSLSDKFEQKVALFTQGETVNISETITNVTDQTRCFPFSSGLQYDVWAATVNGTEVWRWSAGKMFIAAATSFTLAPGESKSFVTAWDQVMNDGSQTPVGTYVMEGYIFLLTPKVEFIIE